MEMLAERFYTQSGRHIEAKSGEVIYNLGCGGQRYPGVIGVDRRGDQAADVVMDLSQTPWPIEANAADAVLAFHTLEHMGDLSAVMGEVYRVLKPGGHLIAEVPYFKHPGAYQDPTHIHFFTSRTFSYFCESKDRHEAYYGEPMRFRQVGLWLGWPAASKNPLARVAKRFINGHKDFYDNYLATFVPVPVLVVELEAIKP